MKNSVVNRTYENLGFSGPRLPQKKTVFLPIGVSDVRRVVLGPKGLAGRKGGTDVGKNGRLVRRQRVERL